MSIYAWEDINWTLVDSRIFRLQVRIFKASQKQQQNKVRYLQKKILRSIDAKVLAVRRVAQTNRGKRSAGADRKRVLTSEQKLNLAQNLKLKGKAKPIRRTCSTKAGKVDKRPLGIPTLEDRAVQQLVKFALEPEWEAKFEPNSYGFRPGRACQDAIMALFQHLRGRSLYVLDADIKKCFDRIDHDKLLAKLNTFPLLENQIKVWLKAGVIEGYSNSYKNYNKVTPNLLGTPQGGVISPLLANIALTGLEDELKHYYANHLYKGSRRSGLSDKLTQVSVIRYVDDFVVLHKDENVIRQLRDHTAKWLYTTMGLELLPEKTKILDTKQGFTFLGFHIISIYSGENKYKCKIHISHESKNNLLSKTREIFRSNRSASAENLIHLLNPLIVGWCNYFSIAQNTQEFKQLEYSIFAQLRKWVFRRRSKGLRSKTSLKDKYFPKDTNVVFRGRKHHGEWIFATSSIDRNEKEKIIFLVKPSWILHRNWIKIQDTISPFNGDNLYWATRNAKYSNWSYRKVLLVKSQSSKCNWCQKPFKHDSIIDVDHIKPIALNGKDDFNNLQALHMHCHAEKTKLERAEIQLYKSKPK